MKKTKMNLPEPEAVREIHRIRARILRTARQSGLARYYLGLNDRPELVFPPSPAGRQPPKGPPAPYRARLAQPRAVREVHEWRRRIQREMERAGTAAYLRRLNEEAEEALVLHDRPAKDYSSK